MRKLLIALLSMSLIVHHFVSAQLQIPPQLSRSPIIIVPGTLGTEMYNGTDKLWPNIPMMVASKGDRFMDPLAFSTAGVPVETGVLTGQVITQELSFDYTNSLIRDLQSQGYTLGKDLFLFSYDWRKDIAQNADVTLKNFTIHVLAQTNAGKVTFITHSQGGLLVKATF